MKRAHLTFSLLNNLEGQRSFEVAIHNYTNQLGFLCVGYLY